MASAMQYRYTCRPPHPCLDCGEVYDPAWNRSQGYGLGPSYCRRCANERVKRSQRRVLTDLTWTCPACGGSFHPFRKQVQVSRPPRNIRGTCGKPECIHAARYPERQFSLCVAPVPGGCLRPSVGRLGFCAGHRKRRERGLDMTIPIRVTLPRDPASTVTRERERQLRQQAKGRCILCGGGPLVTKSHCGPCRVRIAARRDEIRRAKGLPPRKRQANPRYGPLVDPVRFAILLDQPKSDGVSFLP